MRHRLFLIPGAGIAVLLLGVLLFGNLNQNLIYYLTPTEAVSQRADFPDGRRFRLGGQVLEGTLEPGSGGVRFQIGDGLSRITVLHRQAPPQLFREGIGVVVEGAWEGDRFMADTLIVKHDEEYRAPAGDGPYRPPEGEGEA